ncbi:reticulon-4 receptor-like 2b [Syngnathoides biaculeatus]|uniref:reticulon-4 receptor-like 2b n=1 Tax=Syngnathoides biaculeatus TaxID=300417 RepID=UPI002ADD5CF3|nr:reticulon-4 receptor-like 2b [Syngnathoides biaculeatus]XP_061691242.1 reticulon-4 receptor-like 2b [Syngnathoides biaculeatus]XP_061691243.1 reticulon-4 receptor-like 2b [Syngnathoides biaculeatus]XP_061691244.1 reticulon-4 receptor-like 2b [Syngnathoides biaculeatus]XP_061691245.1 reticulon-4 receptor-like 2b [Syngnathoides biaculeatus]XP_061691247.1 reticulon-4 receptor-like 2b [Syngnathoides biaculeatus]XP_061691248.1 reticulon-4 receptor-like 2b [Syngnathoides biaculeatus]XP_06169124
METRRMVRSSRTGHNFKSGLSLWLILWLVVVKPSYVAACPRLCVCYPTPMTVSCQSQNLTIVPANVPYDSQRVFLQNNRITELRADSFGFETQVLWLYGNNITWIEAGAFSNLRVLEELDLGDNPTLRRLESGAFRGLEKLQSLHMHRCKLAMLPHDLFYKLYSLQFLYLQENQLHFLQDDLFLDLVNLTHLFLHGNRIRILSENVFRGLVNLDRLLLHDNRIRQVNRRAFRDLGRLSILYLFNNSLAELPGQAMKDTKGINFLRLNGNPWSCGCEARTLWEWFREVRISSSELICSSPSQHRGQDLRFLRELDFALCPMPDPSLLSGTTTTTFSTKTRWWFSKHKPASSSKVNNQKTTETIKAFPGGKPQYFPKTHFDLFPPKYELSDDEAALPKLNPEEYWADYGNEDAAIRCFDPECSLTNPAFASSFSSFATSPALLHPLFFCLVTFSLHLLFG